MDAIITSQFAAYCACGWALIPIMDCHMLVTPLFAPSWGGRHSMLRRAQEFFDQYAKVAGEGQGLCGVCGGGSRF